MKKKIKTDEENKEIRQLVIERLKTLPSGRKISIGDEGTFSKEQLINHVENADHIGEKIIEVQLSFLQSLKSGEILND